MSKMLDLKRLQDKKRFFITKPENNHEIFVPDLR